MKNINIFRKFLAIMFLVASLAFLFIGSDVHPMARISEKAQLIPSAISATIGVTIFWLIVTLVVGRVYCSTVCPVGTLQDGAFRLRRLITRGKRPMRYRPAKRWRYDLLIAYLLCLLIGVSTVCFTLEPWNALRGAAAIAHEETVGKTWATLSFGVTGGIIVSVIILLIAMVWGFFRGREFCSTVCPIGTALGMATERSLMHIEINPDACTSCMKCEDVCRSSCIKVAGRYVDNSRCVRCFDCLRVCEDDAIHFQINRNRRPATPLLQKRKQGKA